MYRLKNLFLSLLLAIITFSSAFAGHATVEASGYDTTGGALNYGWNWLTDSSYSQYSKWFFDLPEPEKINGNHIGVTLDLLVTNSFNGGSGYSTNVKVIYINPSTDEKGEMVVFLENPAAPPDPTPSQGKGYITSAVISIDKKYVSSDGKLILKVKRIKGYPYHVATNEEAVLVHYTPAGTGSIGIEATDYELIWHLIVRKLIEDGMFFSPGQIIEIRIEGVWSCAWIKYPEPPVATGNISQYFMKKESSGWVILGNATGWGKDDVLSYGITEDVWNRISHYDGNNPNSGPGPGVRTGDIPLDFDYLQALQNSVNSGSDLWRLNPEKVVEIEGLSLGFHEGYVYKLISSGSGNALVEATWLGVTYKVSLSQPVKKGNNGIWAIERLEFKL